ncbi:caspase family protein [Paracoccaceae bacterium Fryx2]|nr:caspase family protein [Paracoccaceae bacterium Fryx2]
MRALVICFFLLFPFATQAAERIALVVGMSAYQTVVTLDNTVNDARAISDTLAGIGFQVTTLVDGTADEFRLAVAEFAFRSETADLALIYFAGHGVEVQGENYLIPVDADIRSNKDVQRQAISLKELLASVDHARKMRIVILDSCRDNPFGDALDVEALTQTAEAAQATRSTSGRGGLAAPSPDRGTLVAFAAKDGERALDGTGENSPFALALIKALPKPGLEISLMFRQVRDEVMQATFNRQEPYNYGSLAGTPFYLAGADATDSVIDNENLRVAWSDLRPDQESQIAALADQGDTRSMTGLAYMRLNAEDSRYAPSEAAKLLSRAADAGYAEAQFELAQLYEIGLGVEQDIPRAVALYHSAAAQDFPDALNDLGFLYYQGDLGVARDPEKALAYFARAADLRQPQSMFNYAALIDDGKIAGKGPADAAEYLYRALRTGSQQVYEILRDKPAMFKADTRKALQAKLAEHDFYAGALDGSFGPGTQRGIRAAYGLND